MHLIKFTSSGTCIISELFVFEVSGVGLVIKINPLPSVLGSDNNKVAPLVHASTELTADIVRKSNLLKGKDDHSNLHPAISTPRSSKLDKEVTETIQSTPQNAAEVKRQAAE